MSRRSYDRQFKMAAVKLVLEDNMSVSEVARELSVHYNSLYRWIVNMKNMEKVRFQVMEAHFTILNMR